MKILIIALALTSSLFANTNVLMKTSLGDIQIELEDLVSPITTQNFIDYVNNKHFDGLIFHRVISDFMIQGGGHKPDMSQADTLTPIINEANNDLSNVRGTISMARTSDPHSATSQFFINVVDNAFLDYKGEKNWGYCVFGKVVKGLDIVDKIKAVKTEDLASGYKNVPVEAVVIISAEVI